MRKIEILTQEKSQLPLTREEIKTLSHQETFRMVMSPAQMTAICYFIKENWEKKTPREYAQEISSELIIKSNIEDKISSQERQRRKKEIIAEMQEYFESLNPKKLKEYKIDLISWQSLDFIPKKVIYRECLIKDKKSTERPEVVTEIYEDLQSILTIIYNQEFKKTIKPEPKKEKLKLDLLVLSSRQVADLRENSEVKPLYDLLQVLLKTGEIQTLPSDLTL